MPRSKPQETRRLLRSAAKHAERIVRVLDKIVPQDIDFSECDERYKLMGMFATDCYAFVGFVSDMLDEDSDEGSEKNKERE